MTQRSSILIGRDIIMRNRKTVTVPRRAQLQVIRLEPRLRQDDWQCEDIEQDEQDPEYLAQQPELRHPVRNSRTQIYSDRLTLVSA